jgi:hypothetical protein
MVCHYGIYAQIGIMQERGKGRGKKVVMII